VPVKIIAEAGVNHNGSIEIAKQLIVAAKKAGADAVKFQTFNAAELVTANALQCAYQTLNTGQQESQLAMLKPLELNHQAHFELHKYCQKVGVEFLSSAFDVGSLQFLVKQLGLTTLKVASGELTNGPFLLQHALSGCDLILSTGMATLSEVQDALAIIAYGLLYPQSQNLPDSGAFLAAFHSAQGKALLKQKVTILHCTTEYPAPMKDINLRVLETLSREFGLQIGYSDHSAGFEVSIAAVAVGANVIEKHFTLDRSLPGPDHKASLEPDELTAMIGAIRNIEDALGTNIKQPTYNELSNLTLVRKSLVCTCNVQQGEIWHESMLTAKRPAGGMSPMRYWDLIGKPATRSYEAGSVIYD
jgi:N-acetylneuraminate synthase